jgi:hypothetical protein
MYVDVMAKGKKAVPGKNALSRLLQFFHTSDRVSYGQKP